MTPAMRQLLKQVLMEGVAVVPRWRLLDAADYKNATDNMFSEVIRAWKELNEQDRHGDPNAEFSITEVLNGNHPCYVLMRLGPGHVEVRGTYDPALD